MSSDAPCGLLVVDKPTGCTSRRPVDQVIRILGRGTKAGHAGTLDPLACGVLVVAVGPATRLIEYVQRMAKTYRATVRLGARSDTDDADGQITPTPDPRIPSLAEIEADLATRQGGYILQSPPRFSALKVAGQRAYDLARDGQTPDLAPRRVRIDRIAILRFQWPELDLEVHCGSGTYIRSIARDLGDALGCGGLIQTLERTRIGPFARNDAVRLDDLDRETLLARLRPPHEALADLPQVTLDAESWRRIEQGQGVRLPDASASEVALLAPEGRGLAIAAADAASGLVRPTRVLRFSRHS